MPSSDVPPLSALVASVFSSYPPAIRKRLMALRRLIFETAAATEGVGELTEALRWGEPAYLTSASKSGTTIRIGWQQSDPERYAMNFNCQTDLVENFRALFPDQLTLEGNRAILFEAKQPVPRALIAMCIRAALCYHRDKADGRRQLRPRRAAP